MNGWVEEVAAALRQGVSYPVLAAFPDREMPAVTPLATVALERVSLRPAGLGDGVPQLAEAVFLVSLYTATAEEGGARAAELPGRLPGLALKGQGVVYDPDVRRFVTRFELARRAVWPVEAPPEAQELVFDWKGEVVHDLHA